MGGWVPYCMLSYVNVLLIPATTNHEVHSYNRGFCVNPKSQLAHAQAAAGKGTLGRRLKSQVRAQLSRAAMAEVPPSPLWTTSGAPQCGSMGDSSMDLVSSQRISNESTSSADEHTGTKRAIKVDRSPTSSEGAATRLQREWRGIRNGIKATIPGWLGGGSDRSEAQELSNFLEAIATEPAFGLERRGSQDLSKALTHSALAQTRCESSLLAWRSRPWPPTLGIVIPIDLCSPLTPP